MPTSSNPNLRAQKGAFTVVRYSDSKRDEVPPPLDVAIQNRADELVGLIRAKLGWGTVPYLHKIMLPHSEAGKLVRWLSELGIGAAAIRPGLHSIVDEMFDQRLHHGNDWG